MLGCTGQIGSHFADYLLDKGLEVYGIVRRVSSPNYKNIEHLLGNSNFYIEEGDITDLSSLIEIFTSVKPDYIINQAAQSHVGTSFKEPLHTITTTGLGAINIFEAARICCPQTRIYHASTSELFSGLEYPQNENTKLEPKSPYGIAKLLAHEGARIYNESYGMFICTGICFNMEGPRRGIEFVTQKIVDAVIRQMCGEELVLELGNMEANRDWQHACINLDVPILTTDGWKYCDSISVGTKIINFDTINNRLSTDEVKEVIFNDSDGEKILLKGRGVYLKVTPDHKIYYQQKSKKSQGNWSDWKSMSAKDFYERLKNKSCHTKYDYRLPHFQDYNGPELECISDEELYLVGALLAEGCLTKTALGRGTTVSISQSSISNKSVHEKIENVIDTLSLKYNRRNRNDGVTEWVFNTESSKQILSWFDTFDVHSMPSYFYSLSQRQAEIVFTAMMDCDGHWGSLTYITTNYKLATDFQTLAHLAGYRTTNIFKREPSFSNLVVSHGTSTLKNIFVVGVVTKSKKYTYIQEIEKINDGETKVWCVRTNNGSIITRDNNCISISGNCDAVEAQWLMLNQDTPQTYVIASGETHSIFEFVNVVYAHFGIDVIWMEKNGLPVGYDVDGKVLVKSVDKYMRPNEVNILWGNPEKAKKELGWKPKHTFEMLVNDMIESKLIEYTKGG